MTYERKITLAKGETEAEKIVKINGIEAICPFVQPLAIPQQNQFGQVNMSITRMPCTTRCPLCIVEEQISFGCDSGCQSFDYEIEGENKTPSGATIISTK